MFIADVWGVGGSGGLLAYFLMEKLGFMPENALIEYSIEVGFSKLLLGVISAISSGQSKSASMKKARAVYERDFTEYFCSEEEQETFLAQMEINDYGRISFMDVKNTLYDKYPTQFVAGPDYLMLLSGSGCKFIRTADIERVRIRGEWTRTSYRAGSFNGFLRAMVGISLAFDYKEEACVRLGLKKGDYMAIFLHHESQVNEIVALIKKHCPTSEKIYVNQKIVQLRLAK